MRAEINRACRRVANLLCVLALAAALARGQDAGSLTIQVAEKQLQVDYLLPGLNVTWNTTFTVTDLRPVVTTTFPGFVGFISRADPANDTGIRYKKLVLQDSSIVNGVPMPAGTRSITYLGPGQWEDKAVRADGSLAWSYAISSIVGLYDQLQGAPPTTETSIVQWVWYVSTDYDGTVTQYTINRFLSDPVAPETTGGDPYSFTYSTSEIPNASRFGSTTFSAQYHLSVPPGIIGTIRWLEVFTPASDPDHPQYTAREWTVDGTTSPEFNLAAPAEGSATVVPYQSNLAVDANRDGQIKLASEDASDATSADKPFRFWLNDDIDVLVNYTAAGVFPTESEEDDRDPNSFLTIVNWESDFISSRRDLEDFSRLWINTQGISDSLKPKADGTADLYLGLQWSDTEGTSPAIKLYKHVEPEGGTEYLNNPDVAQQQVNGALALIDASGQRTNRLVDGTTPYILPPSLFSDLSAAKTKTYLLFEGCKVGKGQLKLVILDKNKQPIGEGPGVWMDLKEPKEFIQRWTCGDTDRGSINPVALDPSKSGTFTTPTTDEEKDMILYVHGYNMQEFEKQCWIETTFKRLYWLGYKGRVGGFTWPCSQSALPFDASEEHAWQAGTQLLALLNTLKGQGYRVHLLGHSQGNVVIGEALRQAGPDSSVATTYIASQAAIPVHCYDAAQPERTDFTPSTPNVYDHYWTANQDMHLPETWGSASPSYLATTYVHGAAGKFVNFYNPQDWALMGNGVLPTATDGSQPGWLADQRLKPDFSYDYASYSGFRENPLLSFSPKQYAFPADRFVIFSYAAQARSLALGATGGTGGVFAGSQVNLFDAPNNFRNQHIYHSGQFRSFYAQRWQYWRQVIVSTDVTGRQKP